jgi:hypothetical protein
MKFANAAGSRGGYSLSPAPVGSLDIHVGEVLTSARMSIPSMAAAAISLSVLRQSSTPGCGSIDAQEKSSRTQVTPPLRSRANSAWMSFCSKKRRWVPTPMRCG